MTEDNQQDPTGLIREKFESQREILEAIAALENQLSEDAELALRILEEDQE